MNESPPYPKRSGTWKAVVLLMLVFVLGIIAGAGGCILVAMNRLQHAARHPGSTWGPAELLLDRMEARLATEMELTATEQDAVHEEIRTTLRKIGELRAGLARDARELTQDSLARIEARLPAEKHARLRDQARKRLSPWGLMDPPQTSN